MRYIKGFKVFEKSDEDIMPSSSSKPTKTNNKQKPRYEGIDIEGLVNAYLAAAIGTSLDDAIEQYESEYDCYYNGGHSIYDFDTRGKNYAKKSITKFVDAVGVDIIKKVLSREMGDVIDDLGHEIWMAQGGFDKIDKDKFKKYYDELYKGIDSIRFNPTIFITSDEKISIE